MKKYLGSLKCVALMAVVSGVLAISCSDDVSDVNRGSQEGVGDAPAFETGVVDTTIVASDGSHRSIGLRRVAAVEDVQLSYIATKLSGETWRWVGMGREDAYKLVFPWHGSVMYSIEFSPNGDSGAAGMARVRCGVNSGDAYYSAEGESLSLELNGFTKVGTLSQADDRYDEFFSDFLSGVESYDIDEAGMLRIYGSDGTWLEFVAGGAAGGGGLTFAPVEECFGTWSLVGVAYPTGYYGGSGEVVLANDYTLTCSGSGALIVPSLADGVYCVDLEGGEMIVDGRRYEVTRDGNRLYLCGGLDFESPTIILERNTLSPSSSNAGSFVQRDGYHVELFLTDSIGERSDRFVYGQNVVFNVAITNESDTAITLPTEASLFHSRRPPFMIYMLEPSKTMQLANTGVASSGGSTQIAAHSTRVWQSPLYCERGVSSTPPLGEPYRRTLLEAGAYYTELYLLLSDQHAVKMRHSFEITSATDGIRDIRF